MKIKRFVFMLDFFRCPVLSLGLIED